LFSPQILKEAAVFMAGMAHKKPAGKPAGYLYANSTLGLF